jgi:hypothetical protein
VQSAKLKVKEQQSEQMVVDGSRSVPSPVPKQKLKVTGPFGF